MIFLVCSASTALGITGLWRLKVNGFTVKGRLKVNGFTVKGRLKVNRFTVIRTG